MCVLEINDVDTVRKMEHHGYVCTTTHTVPRPTHTPHTHTHVHTPTSAASSLCVCCVFTTMLLGSKCGIVLCTCNGAQLTTLLHCGGRFAPVLILVLPRNVASATASDETRYAMFVRDTCPGLVTDVIYVDDATSMASVRGWCAWVWVSECDPCSS